MSKKYRDEITFEGLQHFLQRIGFEQPARTGNALAFHHQLSGTIIVLSIPEDGRTVRAADLLSVVMRLEKQGLVTDSDLDKFRAGKLPLAS
jgi:hypothetical protein